MIWDRPRAGTEPIYRRKTMNSIDIMLKDIDAVIFDLDGTLIDSMGVWSDVDRNYLARFGIEMPENLPDMLSGISISQVADYFREKLGVNRTNEQMLADWNEMAFEEYRSSVPAKPGAMRWLKALRDRNISMAVGTSNSKKLAQTAVDAQNFRPFIQVLLTGEDVVKGKPDPCIYLLAAQRLGADPSRCLVFEDLPAGLTAGRRAGMKTCAVFDLYSRNEDGQKRSIADYYIRDFEDIFADRAEVL